MRTWLELKLEPTAWSPSSFRWRCFKNRKSLWVVHCTSCPKMRAVSQVAAIPSDHGKRGTTRVHLRHPERLVHHREQTLNLFRSGALRGYQV